ncbi:MAG: hypothetical protein ACK5LV_03005 [Lachnospirales bacterium]
MEIDIKISKDMYRDFLIYEKTKKNNMLSSAIEITVILMFFTLIVYVISKNTSHSYIISIILFFLCISYFIYKLFKIRVVLNDKLNKMNLNKGVLSYTMIIDDKGFTVNHSQKNTEHYFFVSIYGVYKYKNYFYIYINEDKSYILPIEYLKNSENSNNIYKTLKDIAKYT